MMVSKRSCLYHVKNYFDHSSIHGLRYISASKSNITERIFWITAAGFAFVGTIYLLSASWYNFQNNPVSFGLDTSFLDWETSFPAISICENESPDKVFESGIKLFGQTRNMNLDFFLRDIVYFDGTCNSCVFHCGKTMNCTKNFDSLVQQVRANCSRLMNFCSWNGIPFDCCDHFRLLQTESGPCFSINSLHTKKIQNDSLVLTSNRLKGPGKLEFYVYESVKFYIHSTEDVPFINHPQGEKATLNWGTLYNVKFQVSEIDNHPKIRQVSVEQRNCRFPDENPLTMYSFYSYSACVVECRVRHQILLCNCTHHFIPAMRGVKQCDVLGLACLTTHSVKLRTLRTQPSSDMSKSGIVCDCKSSCTEPEYNVISQVQTTNEEYNKGERYGTKVTVELDSLPTQRFKRNVVRSRMDLVVSMGGTAGLFLGASLLSTIELIYFSIIKNVAAQFTFNTKRTKVVRRLL